MRDWEGRPVNEPEPPDAIIKVWEIDPYPGDGYDVAVVRDYQNACEVAQRALESLMDGFDAESGAKATLSIRLIDMRLDDYREILDGSTCSF